MPPFGFGDDQISIFAEIPDVVLPRKQASSFLLPFSVISYFPQMLMPGGVGFFLKKIKVGEAIYNSTITLKPEKLPVSVDLMGSFFSPPPSFSLSLNFPLFPFFLPTDREITCQHSCAGMRWYDF